MSLSRQEQEIHISSTRDEEFATIYCSDTTWITKMDKLVKKSPELFKVVAETNWGKTYKFPKKLISLRSSIIKRELTDEQKALAAERLKYVRNNNH